jgi:hypothetical protein
MRTIRKDAESILRAKMHYANSRMKFIGEPVTYTLKTYAEHKAATDAIFFKFLFDDTGIDDFGTNLTDLQIEEYKHWLKKL